MDIRKKALLAVFTGNVIFGFSLLASTIALSLTIPSVMLATRFTTAFLALNVVVLAGRFIKKKDGSPLVEFSLRDKPMKNLLLLAFFQPVVYFIAESYGIVYTSSSFSGVILAVIPVMGVVFDVIILHTKVSKRQVICALCSVVGVIITTLGATNMKSSFLGTILLFGAVTASALYYVYSKKAGEHFTPVERTYVMFGIGSVVFTAWALVQSKGHYQELIFDVICRGDYWMAIGYLAIFSSVTAFLLLTFGTDHVSVSEASIFANLITVISIIAGVVVLNESFGMVQVVGAVIIVISVYLSSVEKKA
ncbi:MAG: DMT family transporter [Eubacterium sp.]|nr:DMT family transporter [Eubacterium sp.]